MSSNEINEKVFFISSKMAVEYTNSSYMNTLWATIIANLIGGLIFFWIDKIIFKKKSDVPLWEIEDNVVCADCNKTGKGYLIVSWRNYDRSEDKHPEFRCKECSIKKMNKISK